MAGGGRDVAKLKEQSIKGEVASCSGQLHLPDSDLPVSNDAHALDSNSDDAERPEETVAVATPADVASPILHGLVIRPEPNQEPSSDEVETAGEDKPAANVPFSRISEMAKARLASIARIDACNCQDSYQFKGDFFVGVHYSHGPFMAKWFVGDEVIRFFRDGNPIGEIAIAPSKVRAA